MTPRCEQTRDGYVSSIRHTHSGETSEILSRVVIGCDGAGSHVRKWAGIESDGEEGCKSSIISSLLWARLIPSFHTSQLYDDDPLFRRSPACREGSRGHAVLGL